MDGGEDYLAYVSFPVFSLSLGFCLAEATERVGGKMEIYNGGFENGNWNLIGEHSLVVK